MSVDIAATMTELREVARLVSEDADAGIDTALDRLDYLAQLASTLDGPVHALLLSASADTATLDAITAIMSGKEWDSDTTSAIRDALAASGRVVKDFPPDDDEES